MKRTLLLLPLLLLAACGGATLDLSITSDDVGENAQDIRTAAAVDLTTVKAVKITVSEIWVHVDNKATGEVKSDEVGDASKGWERVSSMEQTFDLMTVRNQATKPFGEVTVPEGKLTQIRLQLKAATEEGAKVRIAGAVEETNGTLCDLVVPQSAINPGVKISGVLKAMKIEAGGKHSAILNLKLKDSGKLDGTTCAYFLNPELKVKKFTAEQE